MRYQEQYSRRWKPVRSVLSPYSRVLPNAARSLPASLSLLLNLGLLHIIGLLRFRGGNNSQKYPSSLLRPATLELQEKICCRSIWYNLAGTLPEIQSDLKTVRADHYLEFKHPNFKAQLFRVYLATWYGLFFRSGCKTPPGTYRNFDRRSNAIEEAYHVEPALPSERLLLQREQEDCYEQYPERLPSGTYDRVGVTEVKEFWADDLTYSSLSH